MPRYLKIILWVLGSLLFLILVCIALLPILISTSWGTKTALDLFNNHEWGTLKVENIDLNWFGKQEISGLEYTDKNGEKTFSVEHFNTQTSLIYLLFGGRSIGETVLTQPYLVVEQQKKEEKEKKKKKKKKKNGKSKWFPGIGFDEQLTIHDGTVIFKSGQVSPITVSNIYLQKAEDSTGYRISAKTQQGATEGNVKVEIGFIEKIRLTGEIVNFPVAIFDQLDQSTLFTDAIGNTLDINFDLAREPNTSISLSANIKSQNMTGTLSGETREKKLYLDPTSHFTFTLTPRFFKSLLPESQKEEWSLAMSTQVKLEIVKGIFPLMLNKPAFHDMILKANGSIERAEINHATLGSYSLNNFTTEIIAVNNLEIGYQGEIQGKEPSSLSGTLSITPNGDLFFNSVFKGFPVSLVSLISPPVEKSARQLFGQFFNLNAEGSYREGNLEMQFKLTARDLEMNGTLQGDPDNLKFDVLGAKTFAARPAKYMGSTLEYQFEGLANISREGTSIPLINGKLITPFYEIDVKGTIGERGKQLDLNEVELIATGVVRELPFNQDFPNVTLKNGGFFINLDGPSNKIIGQASINTQVNIEGEIIQSKALESHFTVTDFIKDDTYNFKEANITFRADLDNFPLVLFNPFVPGEIDISTLFGKTATISSKGSYTPTQNPRFMLDFNGVSEGTEASLSIALDDTLNIVQNQPGYIRWELTPERYKALITSLGPDHQHIFQLTKPATVELSINELTCPTTTPEDVSHFLCETGFVGDLKIGTLTFRSQGTQEYLIITSTQGSIEGENFSQAIDLHLKGDILAHNVPEYEKSAFQFDGVMLDFWTRDGRFNREGLAIDGELSLELVPVRQITEIYPLDPETKQLIQAVLGELVNARIYGRISQLTGPLTIDVKSSNFKATLPILLNPHAIYLRDRVDAEITLTPEVNQTLLKDINPLLITGAFSDHPIRIAIDPKGFVLPIRPYSLQGVQIESAVIDIGRIRVRNGGQIQQLMTFVKATDITPEGEMTAWFTPIYMSLQNGEATYQRFDMLLANEFHIALWGSINLINDKVRMTLGIAPSTLRKRFKIKGISDTHLFQVKMRGTTNKLDLDWSAASTRIGLLITKTAGGLGALIGGILEQIIGTMGEEPTPPPTTSPFPWQQR